MKTRRVLSVLMAASILVGLMPAFTVSLAADVNDLEFTYSDADDSYTVKSCKESATGELVIPKTYCGKSVTKLGPLGFINCALLTSVVIPDSVTSIEGNCFSGCESLVSVTIPDSVTSMGISAFNRCVNLESITLPKSLTTLSYNVFLNCCELKSITIPDSVNTIEAFAFDGCSKLENITIPASVTSIAHSAFGNCTGLRNVAILNPTIFLDGVVFYNSMPTVHYFADSTVDTIYLLDFKECHTLNNQATTVLAATCTEKGVVSYSCSECNCKFNANTPIDSTNHDFSADWTIDTQATCTTTGSMSHHCSRCDAVSSVTEIPITHSFGTEYFSDAESHWHECDCGATSAPEAHTAGEWTVISEATFLNNRVESSTCTVCGEELVQEVEGTAQSAISLGQDSVVYRLINFIASLVYIIRGIR